MRPFEAIFRAIVLLAVVGCTFLVTRTFFPKVEEVIRVERDTVWEKRDSLIYVEKPVPYEVKIPPDTVYIPETDEELIALYKNLHSLYYTERKYIEKMDIDTIGFIYATYSVFRNESKDFSLGYELNFPTVTETVTVVDSRPFYTVGVFASKNTLVPFVGIGKNRFSVEIGYNKEVYVGIRYIKRFNTPRFNYLSK